MRYPHPLASGSVILADMEPNQPFNAAQDGPDYQTPINQPASGGSVPPPPQQEVNVRTLASDISSMQQQGGSAPLPQKVSPMDIAASGAPTPSSSPNSGGKGWLWLIIIALLIVMGLAYYYFFYMSAAVLETTREETATEQTENKNQAAPLTTGEIEYGALVSALQNEASQPLPSGNLKEIAIVNGNNQIISFASLVKAVLLETVGSELEKTIKNNFEDAFKAYLYYDDNGVWPVYSAMMRGDATADVVSLQNQLRVLERSIITNFYLSSPGTASGEFKDGQVKGFPTRYQAFSQPGASFNYGLINGQLYLATSYNALKSLVQ